MGQERRAVDIGRIDIGRMRDLYTQRHIVRIEDIFYTVGLVIGLVVLLDWLFQL